MNRIRQLHLYLGTLFAPLIIFFAFSGALQTFTLHESPKDGAYQPPAWIATLAKVHKDQRTVHAPGAQSSVALKWFIALMAIGLIATSLLGISMAFKYNRDRRLAVAGLSLDPGARRVRRGSRARSSGPDARSTCSPARPALLPGSATAAASSSASCSRGRSGARPPRRRADLPARPAHINVFLWPATDPHDGNGGVGGG